MSIFTDMHAKIDELEASFRDLLNIENKDGKGINFQTVFNAYYPVIEAARKVRTHYIRGGPEGKPLIAPDECGELIEALNTAEKIVNIRRTPNEESTDSNDDPPPSTDTGV